MFHIGDMEDAGHRPFQNCKDPLHTGTEAHRPAKDSATDQACGANRSRSKFKEEEGCGTNAPSPSTRPPGGGDGRDLETYFRARRYSCRKNRERIGHSGALLSEEIADAGARAHIGNAEKLNGDVLDAQTLPLKAAGKLKALALFVVEGLRGAHAGTRVLGAGAR